MLPALISLYMAAVLVLVIWFTPRGLIGGLTQARKVLMRRSRPAAPSAGEARHG